MLDNREVVLIGYSGHGFVVAEVAFFCSYKLRYYAEKREIQKNPYNLIYMGDEREENFGGWNHGYGFLVSVGNNRIREKIALTLLCKNENILSIIHPYSIIAKNVKLGIGIFVAPNVSVNALAEIGAYSILNTGCIIEHECEIGQASHIAPGAVLAGDVKVGDRTFVGANAVIKQGIVIGKDVVVGAGSVVLRNIPDSETWAGNPARRLK